MRSGYVHLLTGYSRNVDYDGFAWSSLAVIDSSGMGAGYFFFNISEVATSRGPNSLWIGRPLRWLTSGGDYLPNGYLVHAKEMPQQH